MVITCLRPEDHDRPARAVRLSRASRPPSLPTATGLLPPGETEDCLPRSADDGVLTGTDQRRPLGSVPQRLVTPGTSALDQDGYFYILDRKNDM